MSGLDKIAETIKKEAQAKADKIIAQAQAKAGDIAKKAAAEMDEYKKSYQETISREAQAVRERYAADGRQARKQALLKARSMVIEDTIAKAKDSIKNLPDGEYFDFLLNICLKNAQSGQGELYFAQADLDRLPGDFMQRCNAGIADGSLELAGGTPGMENGFIIKYGNIEQNCSIDSIFESKRNLLWDTANSCLAGVGE